MESQWTPIKEEKPPMTQFNDRNHPDVMGKEQQIIVATKEGTVKETIFTRLGFANIGREEVTHWMLMPENPNK